MSTVISIPKMPIRTFIGLLLACCFILGVTGDVPDGVVYTDLHQNVLLESRAVLKCEFYKTPLAVYWKKGDTPSSAPNLITWGKDEPDSGSCVNDKMCEMGDDYSLIIKNVSIADQGRYICRISNYRGILIHNFTDVKVLALPEEPYPIIDECKENQGGNCIFIATDPVNITCTVLKYYPNVDLFFLHGSKKYSTADTLEWSNTDGTKSKSIFTTAPPSEIPYGCVAFNIPGSHEQRTVTFKVTFQDNVTTTQAGVPIERNKMSVVIIAVPIIAVIFIAAGILLCLMKYCRKSTGREEKDDVEATALVSQRKIKGKISYYDVWLLVRHFMERGNSEMLRDTLCELSVSNIPEILSGREAYELLCKWKEDNRMDNEAEILEETLKIVLNKRDYERAWNDVCETRENSSNEIGCHTLEHILWNINGLQKINEFLRELISDRTISIAAYTGKKADIVQSSLKKLTEWSNGQHELNPLVLLSSALEKVECKSVAKTFFLVPGHLTSNMEPKEVKGLVRKLTSRHCKRLTSGKISSDKLDITIEENDNMLFDTSAMITDWFDQLECSNYEKRCRLDDAIIKIGRYDMQDCLETISNRPGAAYHQEHLHLNHAQFDHGSIFDDDIPQLVNLMKYIPLDKISDFHRETGLSPYKDEDTVKQELRKRRDNILARIASKDASSEEFTSFRKELAGCTTNFDFTLTDEEINDVVAQVTSTDKQQQLIRKLHISADAQQSFVDQLKRWRNTEKKTKCRKQLQESLKQIGFRECIVYKSSKKFVYHAELSNIALNLLMEDVRPIIDALAINRRKVSSYIKPPTEQEIGTKRLVMKLLNSKTPTGDFCKALRNIGFVDVSKSVYFDYEPSLSELIHIVDCVGKCYMDRFLEHLDLDPDDTEECRDSEGQIDKLKLMRLWKRQIRPVPYHYRLEIATALTAAQLNEIAYSVLSGEHRQKMPNPDVIKDICSRLDDVMRNKLFSLLKRGSGLKEEASTALAVKLANRWMNKYDPKDTSTLSGHMEERKNFNNTLFSSGIHELAEEIAALENSQLLVL